jgi:twitching motility protein PilJ
MNHAGPNDGPAGSAVTGAERMADDMGTMGAKEIGEPTAAEPITVQPFRYTEFAGTENRPRIDTVAAAGPPTQRIDRSQLKTALEDRKAEPWASRMVQRLQQKDLPVLGKRPLAQQLQILLPLLGLFVCLTVIVLALDQRAVRQQTEVSEQFATAMVNNERMARAAVGASEGNAAAIAELKASRDQAGEALLALGRNASGPAAGEMTRFAETWKPFEAAATRIVSQEKALLSFGALLAAINEATPRLTALADEVAALKLQQNASAREAGLAGQLSAATWRLARNANALPSTGASGGTDPTQALTRDLEQIRDSTQALMNSADGEVRSRLQQIAKISADLQTAAAAGLPAARAAAEAAAGRRALQGNAEAVRQKLTSIQTLFATEQGGRAISLVASAFFGLLSLATMLLLMQVLLRGSRRRAQEADAQRLEAQRHEQAAKRANEGNQAAILRLMNELQEVADGNLTVQATVTEDITGAIADSINYTVEELRGLVGRINETAEQVNSASTEARDIATGLMTSSESQARDIKDTGTNVLQMTAKIGDVSRAAGESARVARVSLEAAERGQRAVYNQIAGMNEIREQIQETAKRIKRLGESSQEIGEIVELISDITEQTNVLALNAAIQAASAGEAGRGFTVVAEEVQRLADRSAEAAKQIAALVKTIQTDTQDAVAAMEKSTQGVVEGTKLSDAAGTALADIGRVSRQLAELIEQIAGNTQEQASSADGVAHAIERILSVNEQTTEGTRRAAQSIGQLAGLARELKDSVARFRVS